MKSRLKRAFDNVYTTRIVLGISGSVALVIAGTILIAPETFYGSYGIEVASNPTLINELKAPAGMLLCAGLLMLGGIIRRSLSRFSLMTAAAVYLSYGLSRVLSILLDGMPDSGMVSAAAIELVIGAICLLTLHQVRQVQAHKFAHN